MPNTIDINLGDNNSMESLSFYWMAEFNNGVIFQFEGGKEHLYKEVKDRINELEFFHLYHKNKDIRFIVDLRKGIVKYNNSSELNEAEEKQNIRLIFFRRHRVKMTENCVEKSHTIEYHLGFQWNDKLGNNRKTVLQLDSEGNFLVTGE